MKKSFMAIPLLAIGFALGTGNWSAKAQNATENAQAASSRLEAVSALNYLHHVNNVEIRQATIANSVSQNDTVRSFANQLLSDHQQNETQVVQLAQQKGISLFTVSSSTWEFAQDNFLTTLSPAEFDSVFLDMQSRAHQEVLTHLQMVSSKLTDPEIKALVDQTILVVQQHIQLSGGPQTQTSGTPSPVPSVSVSPGVSPSPSVSPTSSPSSSPSP